MSEILPAAEAAELADCEQLIERGLQTFLDVGRALVRIRDGRLYRASHASFEDYCRGRWQLGRSHAYRLIDASETVAALSPIGDTQPPVNEAQARALAPLRDDPELMTQAWQQAMTASGGKPTARMVAAVVDAIRQAARTEARGGAGSDRVCAGCAICNEPGIIAHYPPRASTTKPSPAHPGGQRRVVYVDGHGVAYDRYSLPGNAGDDRGLYANASVRERQLPSGEPYTEIRVPAGRCGIPACPACDRLGQMNLGDSIGNLMNSAAQLLVIDAAGEAAAAELARIGAEWQHLLDGLARIDQGRMYEAEGHHNLRDWITSTGYLGKVERIIAEGPELVGITVPAGLTIAVGIAA